MNVDDVDTVLHQLYKVRAWSERESPHTHGRNREKYYVMQSLLELGGYSLLACNQM